MRLKSFRVRVFRNIVDSGEILVDDSVTAFVGKNEAGKSALLQALHRLNPAKPPARLDLLDEYPRWLKKQHEISGEINEVIPITASFELEPEERSRIDGRFGPGVLADDVITFSRAYAKPDELKVGARIHFPTFIEPFVGGQSERLQSAIGTPPTSDALVGDLNKLIDSGNEADAKSVNLAADAVNAKGKLEQILGDAPNLTKAVNLELISMIPTTFYFSNYSQLRSRYTIETVFDALQNGSDDASIQAAADFLRLARVAPTTVEDWDFEASNAELESISSLLTQRVKTHWHQNDHLKLGVKLEVRPDTSGGTLVINRFLQFRVEDTRHDFSSRLDRRSTGFQWFISFIASFLEFETTKNLILLLDEPGLSLHARAQMDLLDTIDGRLASDRQVLYTTHSPFMVRTNRLDRVRITEDQGPTKGAVVVNDAGIVTDSDTLFPLQAALGYDIAQSLFIGNQNVIVEGVSDFIYLTTVSDYLESVGRPHLLPTARLLPAGGATNIPTFIALLGGQLDVAVVLDGNTDQQRINNAIVKGRLDQARIVDVSAHSPTPHADIEDLFEPVEYLSLYNGAFNMSVAMADLTGNDRIVKRIERQRGSEYNHGIVAAFFLRNLQPSLASLSAPTLDRFESLVQAINAAPPTR